MPLTYNLSVRISAYRSTDFKFMLKHTRETTDCMCIVEFSGPGLTFRNMYLLVSQA